MNLSTRATLAAIYYARRHRTDAPGTPPSARVPHATTPQRSHTAHKPYTPTQPTTERHPMSDACTEHEHEIEKLRAEVGLVMMRETRRRQHHAKWIHSLQRRIEKLTANIADEEAYNAKLKQQPGEAPLLALVYQLHDALLRRGCDNCGGQKCTSCVFREMHDHCNDDCMECVPMANVYHPNTKAHVAREAALDAFDALLGGSP
jgi:hypothetical protein